MNSYLRVLRHPNFRHLFLGQSASVIGDRVVVVAIALYVTQTTGSATDLGLILASQALPLVALLLFGECGPTGCLVTASWWSRT